MIELIDMNKKTILVVMPIYNAKDTLAKAIESVLGQTYKNIHLVLVDDASTDGSFEIAKQYTYDNRVTLLKNSVNRGAYYSRNAGIYFYRNENWGYFTTHDADDVSYPNRFDSIIKVFNNSSVNAVQDTFERKDFYTGRSQGSSLTIAHAAFKRSVLDSIGYFEEVRFGGDWEYWARLTILNQLSSTTTRSISQQVGESFVLKNNLTVRIPLGSRDRRMYILSSRKKHAAMTENNNFYIDFELDGGITKKVNYTASAAPIKKSGPKTTIVLLTWKRLPFLKKTLLLLSNQTYKDFDVRITNANLEHSQTVEKIASQFSNKLDISITHDGNEIKAFRRFTVGNDLARNGTEIVLFIDDDITFPSDYVERLIANYEPKIYASGFAWNFQQGGEDYYRYRTRRWNNDEKIHYCGTGISMIDAKIFLDKRLFNAPKEAYYIEDLWLSYFAQHVLGWDLKYINVGNVHIGGADQHALYKKILNDKKTGSVPDKADFLRLLIKKYGWKL